MGLTFVNDGATVTAGADYFLGSDSTTKTDQTDDCILECWINQLAMAISNQVTVKLLEKINGGTQRTVFNVTLLGTQSSLLVIPAFILGDGWEVQFTNASGADIAIEWSLRKITGGLTLTDNSASIGSTEFFLASNSTTQTAQTTQCLLQVWIDFANMAAGDRYVVRVYEKVNGAGATQALAMPERIVDGAQGGPLVLPITLVGNGWDIGVAKLAGTDRTINWSLRKAA